MESLAERLYFVSPVSVQNILVSVMGYRLYSKRYTGIYHELRELIRESREWSTEKRDTYQSEKLYEMVKHCRRNIPFYQRLFAAHGLHENDVTQLSDIKKIPVLTKDMLKEAPDDFRQKDVRPYVTQHTSGSTGSPLQLFIDERTYKLAMALLVDHEEYHGVPFKTRRATFAGRMIQRQNDLRPPFSRLNKAENQRLYSSYHLNDSTFAHYDDDLERFQPLEIIGYPSAISDLAAHYHKNHQHPNYHPKAIITNSETLLEWQRKLIESIFNCPVFDYYGTAEYVLFAGQDESGLYRLNPVIGVTELSPTDSDTGTGKIIATTLSNRIMPLLRYEVGDLGTVPNGASMEATHIEKLKQIEGRIDDYILTPDGRKIGRIDHIFKGLHGIREAQVVQEDLYNCTVRVVPVSSPKDINQSAIVRNLKARTGQGVEVKVKLVPEIPKGQNGKFRSVISFEGRQSNVP